MSPVPQTFIFAKILLIHSDDWGLMAIGRICHYCAKCGLIMVHQDELEEHLAYILSEIAQEVIGKNYMVIGTVEKSIWKSGLKKNNSKLGEVLKHTAGF